METWFRLPLVVRVTAIVLGWLAYLAVVLNNLVVDSAEEIAPYVGITCAVGATLTAVADHRLHRRFDSPDQLTTYRCALRTGKLPKGVDLAQWHRWIRGSESVNASAALWVFPALMFGLFTSLESQWAYRWVPGAVFGVLILWGGVKLIVRGADVRHLKAVVKHRAEAAARAAGTPADTGFASFAREGAFEMSLAGRLLSGCLTWFVSALLVILVVDLESFVFDAPRIMPIAWAVAAAALMAVAWAVFGEDRDLRRDFASFAEYTAYIRAVRMGEIPPDIEPDVWQRRLTTTRRENTLRLALVLFCVGVGIAAIASHQSVYHWVIATVLQLLAIRLLVIWWSSRERLAAMSAQVQRHAVRQTWG
jgi:hypothetical protein